MRTPLTPHFTLEEFRVSSAHQDLAARITFGPGDVAKARRLADLLERVRERFGPVVITSGKRNRALNTAVGRDQSVV